MPRQRSDEWPKKAKAAYKQCAIRLRRALDAKGWSNVDLANKMPGTSATSVGHWRNAIHWPDGEERRLLTELLQLTLDEVTPGTSAQTGAFLASGDESNISDVGADVRKVPTSGRTPMDFDVVLHMGKLERRIEQLEAEIRRLNSGADKASDYPQTARK